MPSSFCEPSAGISDSDPGERLVASVLAVCSTNLEIHECSDRFSGYPTEIHSWKVHVNHFTVLNLQNVTLFLFIEVTHALQEHTV